MKKIGIILVTLGVDPRRIISSLLFVPFFLRDFYKLISQSRGSKFKFKMRIFPVLSDARSQAGIAKGHYYHQDLWYARQIYKERPKCHLDVGSRIDGFVAHILTFMDVIVLDVRKITSKTAGLDFYQADLMDRASVTNLKSESVSCLHALEHFGLGRYGDPVDIDGWQKGLENLSSIVSSGGFLYLSVPVGEQVIEFNAHRVFLPETIVDAMLALKFEMLDFSYVDDHGDFHEEAKLSEAGRCKFGCGCFVFRRVI